MWCVDCCGCCVVCRGLGVVLLRADCGDVFVVVRCSLLAVCCCSCCCCLFVVVCSLVVVCCCIVVVCCLLIVGCRAFAVLFAVSWFDCCVSFLFVVCGCPLLNAGCLLYVACCLLFDGCCFL